MRTLRCQVQRHGLAGKKGEVRKARGLLLRHLPPGGDQQEGSGAGDKGRQESAQGRTFRAVQDVREDV